MKRAIAANIITDVVQYRLYIITSIYSIYICIQYIHMYTVYIYIYTVKFRIYQEVLGVIYIYSYLFIKTQAKRNLLIRQIAHVISQAPGIGSFLLWNACCRSAEMGLANRISGLRSVQNFQDGGGRGFVDVSLMKLTNDLCQGRSQLLVLGINSSHL